jgi:hypothetical protein
MLISAIAIAFLASLIALIGVMSLLRQWRMRQQQVSQAAAELAKPALVETVPPPPAPITPPDTITKPIQLPIPEAYRLPAQDGEVVISIEPDSGPTRDQRNVQRLIEFLKTEMSKPAKQAS